MTFSFIGERKICSLELPCVPHRSAVHSQNDIAYLHARLVGWAARRDIAYHHAPILRKIQAFELSPA